MAVLGDNTVGATLSVALTGDVKSVSRFPVASPLQFTTGYHYLVNNGTAAQAVRMVVYADSSGAPGALLGQSIEQIVQPVDVATPPTITGILSPPGTLTAWPDGWVQFSFPSVVLIDAGFVWVGLHRGTTGGNVKSRYNTGTSAQRNDVYSDGPADPFGTPTAGTFQWSTWIDVSAAPVPQGISHVYSYAAGRAT